MSAGHVDSRLRRPPNDPVRQASDKSLGRNPVAQRGLDRGGALLQTGSPVTEGCRSFPYDDPQERPLSCVSAHRPTLPYVFRRPYPVPHETQDARRNRRVLALLARAARIVTPRPRRERRRPRVSVDSPERSRCGDSSDGGGRKAVLPAVVTFAVTSINDSSSDRVSLRVKARA